MNSPSVTKLKLTNLNFDVWSHVNLRCTQQYQARYHTWDIPAFISQTNYSTAQLPKYQTQMLIYHNTICVLYVAANTETTFGWCNNQSMKIAVKAVRLLVSVAITVNYAQIKLLYWKYSHFKIVSVFNVISIIILLVQDPDVNQHIIKLFHFSLLSFLVCCFLSYVFLTYSTLVTQTSPSSILVCVFHVSGRFKKQGDDCHFIFSFCSLNIHFTSCSDCGSEEMLALCQLLLYFTLTWTFPFLFLPNFTKQFSCHTFEFLSVYSSNIISDGIKTELPTEHIELTVCTLPPTAQRVTTGLNNPVLVTAEIFPWYWIDRYQSLWCWHFFINCVTVIFVVWW